MSAVRTEFVGLRSCLAPFLLQPGSRCRYLKAVIGRNAPQAPWYRTCALCFPDRSVYSTPMHWRNSPYSIRALSGLPALWPQGLLIVCLIAQWHPYDAFFWTPTDDRQQVTGEPKDVAAFSSLSSSVIAKKLFPHTVLIAPPSMADFSSSGRSSNGERPSIAWLLKATAAPRAPPSLKL